MPPATEPWFSDFLLTELDFLLEREQKRKQSTSGGRTVNANNAIRRTYDRTNGGRRVCCKDDHPNCRIMQLVEILDAADIVRAAISDSSSLVNAKFSHRAKNALKQKNNINVADLRPGARFKLTDYEVQLTLFGDEAWNVTLLINGFHLISETSKVYHRRLTPISNIEGVRRGLHALLGKGKASSSPRPNSPKRKKSVEIVEIDSDIASQDGRRSESSLNPGSPLATQTQAHKRSIAEGDANTELSSGVSLSRSYEPRWHGMDREKLNSNGEQLLALLSAQKKPERKDQGTHQDGEVGGARQLDHGNTSKPAGVQGRDLPEIIDQEPNPLMRPAVSALESDGGSTQLRDRAPLVPPLNLRIEEYSSTHIGNFKFANRNDTASGPEEEQRKILQKPTSWFYPEPGHKFPGLNVPMGVFQIIQSWSGMATLATSSSGAQNDINDLSEGEMDLSGNLDEWRRIEDQQKGDAIPGNDVADEVTESSGTPVTSWSESEYSSSIPERSPSPGEPRDSSLEIDEARLPHEHKAIPVSGKRHISSLLQQIESTKRPRLTNLDSSRQGSPSGATSIARRAKQDFMKRRRAQPSNPITPEKPSAIRPHDFKSRKSLGSASSTKVGSSPNTVLQLRSPDDVMRASDDNDPKFSLEDFQSDKVAESSFPPKHDVAPPSLPSSTVLSRNEQASLLDQQSASQRQSSPHTRLSEDPVACGETPQHRLTSEHLLPQNTSRINTPKSSGQESSFSVSLSTRSRELPWAKRHDGPGSKSPSTFPVEEVAHRNDTFDGSLQVHSNASTPLGVPGTQQESSLQRVMPGANTAMRGRVEEGSSSITAMSSRGTEDRRGLLKTPTEAARKAGDRNDDWWRTDDTVFKRFAREYASLKALDGVLGTPSKEHVLDTRHEDLDIFGWRL